MRNRFMASAIALVAVLALSPLAFAQNPSGQGAYPIHLPKASKKSFNAHDISGIWLPTGYLGLGQKRPVMTDWGKAKWSTTRSAGRKSPLSFGYYLDPKDWNDPLTFCDPLGYPRDLWYGGRGSVKMMQTPSEIVEFFEQSHFWRDLWTDGRKLPDDPEPRWFGYSVAHWNGDTLVVESLGFNDKAWLDGDGSIFSDQMKLEERYHRPDHDQVELNMTLTDPMTYTTPWVSEKTTLKWQDSSDRIQDDLWGKKADGTPYGDIREDFCIYSEQKDFFTNIEPLGDKSRLSIIDQK